MLREAHGRLNFFSSALFYLYGISCFITRQRGRLALIREIIMKQKYLFAALLWALTPLACAEAANAIDEVVVTATRLPQQLSKTIADTTVLTEQEIRNSGAADVPTLLRSLVGVEVAQSGGLGATAGVFMRGTNSNQVLVLIDGVRVDSATTGATALEQIMLDSIERIEVVRGNVSSLYGSSAIGGVIQIFTKQGKGEPAFQASAGAGSHDTQKLAAGFSGSVADTSFNVNVGRVKTDGVSAINPVLAAKANPNNNGYDNNTLNASIKQAINADHALTASVFGSRGNVSFDSSSGSPTDLNNSVETIDKFSLISDDQLGVRWHSQLRLAQGSDDVHSYKNGAQASYFTTQSNQFAWQNNLKIAEGQQLSLSAENLGQAVSSSTVYAQTARNVNSVLGSYIGEYGVQQVQLNVRQDNYSDFGMANTGLLGYGVAFAEGWRATASISNAFRAPTFNELFYPNYGSSNVKAERSQNQEIGLHYATNGQRLSVVYFDNIINDLIVYNSATATVGNINRAEIIGQELSYAGDFGSSHLKVSATFQDPHDTTTGAALARRAREFSSLAASHDFEAWNVGAEVRYSGERQDSTHTLASYSLLNLTSRYKIDKHLSLSARVDNVFNRDYQEVYSYNTLGATLFVGMNYQQ
jgi:vitamin B12 transporter